jgi:hypothetical protein
MTRPAEFSRFICVQCGTQFLEGKDPPGMCLVCRDERQFERWEGQAWTTLEELRIQHQVVVRDDAGLMGIGIEPSFAIGQRALLVPYGASNLLWDCISLLDSDTVSKIRDLGGIAGIAISHPHYYSAMVEWSEAFDDVPIFLHQNDRRWVMRLDRRIRFWEGETLPLGHDLSLHRLGGHFAGASVLHHPNWDGGKGAILAGDVIQVVPDRRWVSFMYSYPNLIPLPPQTVLRMAEWVGRLRFERIYGAWWGRNVLNGGREVVRKSAERYVRALDPLSLQ